jgi:hypothetical protein
MLWILLLCVLILATLNGAGAEAPTLTRSLTYTKDLRDTVRA